MGNNALTKLGGLRFALVATLAVTSCSKPGLDSIISDYSNRLSEDAKRSRSIPEISDDTKAAATRDKVAVDKHFEESRAAAQDKTADLPASTVAAAEDCLRSLTIPTSGNAEEIRSYSEMLARCKSTDRTIQNDKGKTSSKTNDDAKAFHEFIKWAEIAGAIASLIYGNYPLAAVLLAAAQSEGSGGGSGRQASEGSGTELTLSKSTGDPSTQQNSGGSPGSNPAGWSTVGTSASGLQVAFSPDFQTISFQGAGMPRVEAAVPTSGAQILQNSSISACTDAHAGLSGARLELVLGVGGKNYAESMSKH